MIRSVWVDVRQAVFSSRFVASCVILLALMFSARGVLDNFDAPHYSVFSMIFKTNRSLWMQSTAFSGYEVWMRGMTVNHLGAFLPAMVAFPLIPLYCDELKSQNYRFHLMRGTERRYIFSKSVAAMLSGCCVVLVCVLLFALVCGIVFPSLSAYSPDAAGGMQRNVPWLQCFQLVFFLLAFAAADAMVCLLLAAVTADKFSSLCLPVTLYFLCNQVAQKLYVHNHDIRCYILSPDQQYQPFQWLPQLLPWASVWTILLLPLAISLLCLPLIALLTKRRTLQ